MNEREVLIRKGLNRWRDNNYQGILNYATGVGKTYGAILAADKITQMYPNLPILWVCPTREIIKNTQKEFFKFKKKKLLNNIQFICYRSLGNNTKQLFSLIVFDECHHVTGPKTLEAFKKVRYIQILGLSASLTDKQKYVLHKKMPIVHTLTLSKVTKENFVAPFTFINLAVTLTPKEQKIYDKQTSIIDFAYRQYGTQAWKKIGIRTRLLYDASRKKGIVKKLTKLLKDEKGIIFTMTQKQADQVADLLGETSISIHSGFSDKEREKRLKSFNDKRTKIKTVATPKIFDEGVTVPDLTYGILLARSSTKRQNTQTVGRLLRNDIKGKHSLIIRLYCKGTIEEKWIAEAQKDIEVINFDTYNELLKFIKKQREGEWQKRKKKS